MFETEYWDHENDGYEQCEHCGYDDISLPENIAIRWQCPKCGLVHGKRVD